MFCLLIGDTYPKLETSKFNYGQMHSKLIITSTKLFQQLKHTEWIPSELALGLNDHIPCTHVHTHNHTHTHTRILSHIHAAFIHSCIHILTQLPFHILLIIRLFKSNNSILPKSSNNTATSVSGDTVTE